ncbi:IPT/TIG domain-containing protein [Tieghemostelium lacteum]|uniref:IPT/TIG domain-containing protein n=1 Tax=Tieghemostelium lacteum TaxID=361077 RepID=A0A151Z3U5_TIELA|nr:IPT/TIG domain-containing protein [Tieghemostelium lacteum]|eukprot:KYQ88587.1 IPT/TIG domain-containing protein [Tieghemostelium lacteum]
MQEDLVPLLIYRDKTEEFKEKKLKYLSNDKNELENLQLKLKKISLNVNTVFNNQQLDELSKIVINCTICGSTFGKIFQKKQKCQLCDSIVCSNCNNNLIALNLFDQNAENKVGPLNSSKDSKDKDKKDKIYSCNQCWATVRKLLKKREIDKQKDLSMNSSFTRFYEQMHLNILDLNRNLPKFKTSVDSIRDSSSIVDIAKAKDIEPIVTINIKELESGVRQLKLLQSPSKIQSQVIMNLKHYFAQQLQTSIPDFRLYTSEFQRKRLLPPNSQPIDITTSKSTSNNSTSKDNNNNSNSKDNSNNNKDNNSNNSKDNSPPSSISSFFSSVSKSIVEGVNSLTSKNDNNQNNQNSNNNGPEYQVEIMDPNQSTVISVGPAIVPLMGSLVTITGQNLLKNTIKVMIGGMEIRGLKYHNSAIMLQTPPFSNEGEVELIIKEGQHVLSHQFLFYTNSCFQTEKDLSNANNYALETYQLATNEPQNISNGKQIVQENYMDREDSFSSIKSEEITDDDLFENVINLDDLEVVNTDHSFHFNNNHNHFGTNSNQQKRNRIPLPSTGNTVKDIILEDISPMVSPVSGTKISILFKYPVNDTILVSVGQIPIQYVDINDHNRKITFLSPPLKEGIYSIEIQFNSKVLEVPNILTYEKTHSSLPPVNLNFEENKYNKTNLAKTNTNNGVVIPKNRYLKDQAPIVSKSSRVWGIKSDQSSKE